MATPFEQKMSTVTADGSKINPLKCKILYNKWRQPYGSILNSPATPAFVYGCAVCVCVCLCRQFFGLTARKGPSNVILSAQNSAQFIGVSISRESG